ncbi:hypothetical protein GR138_12965 [Shinella kummerowiae]|uniref:Uncharacterized protein n=1 Tax=Shinella kummerowiae TaxID=417745 RepID=A0A6N8SGT6_9HYPH|nr:hypothetical protein [Shinella kummerowiae]MXN46102.1 hypothetical protein [Shinella kummerowiae]
MVDTLVLERETNGQSKEFMDWAVFMTVRAFEEQTAALALQLEAMKREMAEKDERIAVLTGIDSAQDLVSDWLSEGTDDLPDDTPVRIEIGSRTVIGDRLCSLRRARTLVQGEKP